MSEQLELLEGCKPEPACGAEGSPTAALPHLLDEYDRIVVLCSGGKDSVAALLLLLDLGAPRDRIRLDHHMVDGAPGESDLFDYPCTRAYVDALGAHFDVPVFHSFRRGGIEREMLRENCGSAPIVFTRSDGTTVELASERSKPSTRRRYPQQSASLSTRWCSAYAKIGVADRMFTNDEVFRQGKTLVVSGERAEESPNRARYAEFEPHRADLRHGREPRWLDHWRPVLRWREAQVWDKLREHRLLAHPAYWLGFSRCSCLNCVFLNKDGWASVKDIVPERFERLVAYEESFGTTLHRTMPLRELAARGKSHVSDRKWVEIALSTDFNLPMVLDPWRLPPGAYGENAGPN